MKTKIFFFLSLLAFSACIDEADERFTTFEDDTITSFCESNPEMYSEFSKFMKATGMSDLLNAYGTYTCFLPTNEAFQKYYAKKNTSFEQLTEEELREITYTHILKRLLRSKDFPQGVIPEPNLYEQFMYISYGIGEHSSIVYINENARILIIDQQMHNGVIHTVDAVLEPSKIQLPEIIADNPRYSLFSQALHLTKMDDSLRLINDYSYKSEKIYSRLYNSYWDTPPLRKFGYTAFIESDSLYKANDIYNMEDLQKYAATVYDRMYPADKNVTNVTDRSNSLNRFVSYHLMEKMQAENDFFPPPMVNSFVAGLEMHEYMEMMCPNTMMEVAKVGDEALINKRRNGNAIRMISPNHAAENGIYHEIDKILVYDETVTDDVLNKKIRIESGSMLPELTTNKVYQMDYCMYLLPQGYSRNLTFSESTEVYYKINRGFGTVGGEEIILGCEYDFTLRIPPLPAGTYEIRFRYEGGSYRSVAQLFFDGEICGIPADLKITAGNPKVGYVPDADTDDGGLENDKMMRNRGFMKDINTAWIWSHSMIARDNPDSMRKILLTKTFTKTEPHFLRVKSVEERNAEFQLDYMEFVPTQIIPTEGKD